MARLHTRRSPRRNLLASGEDELAGGVLRAASINNSAIPSHTPIMSQAPTPAPTLLPAFAMSVVTYTDKDLQKATRLGLNIFVQRQEQASAVLLATEPREKYLKDRFPDLYHENLHIDYHRFYQPCKVHFETTEAKKPNQISFVASFLRGRVT